MSKQDASESHVKEVEESGEDLGLLTGKPRRFLAGKEFEASASMLRGDCSWTCLCDFVENLGGAVGYRILVLLFFVQHVPRRHMEGLIKYETYILRRAWSWYPRPPVVVVRGCD